MYIVTGAAGFIGSVLVQKLNSMGIENIVCVDRLEDDDKWLNLRGLKFDQYIHADEFIQKKFLDFVFSKNIQGIFHMGACSSTTETDVDYLMKNNLEYSQIIFEYCAEFNVPLCYASSAATYGGGEFGYSDEHEEIEKFQPLNPYGYSKHLMDEWALKQDLLPSRWYGVKFFNVYGPNEYHKGSMKSVVCHAYKQIKETGKMKLFKSYKEGFEDGEQLRDFVYVKDVVDAMVMLMHTEHDGQSGIYNLGTGTARTFDDLVEATFKAMQVKENVEYIDMPDHLKNQYQYFTEAKMDKLLSVFPDFKFHTLEEGVHDYVRNYLMKQNPYHRIRE